MISEPYTGTGVFSLSVDLLMRHFWIEDGDDEKKNPRGYSPPRDFDGVRRGWAGHVEIADHRGSYRSPLLRDGQHWRIYRKRSEIEVVLGSTVNAEGRALVTHSFVTKGVGRKVPVRPRELRSKQAVRSCRATHSPVRECHPSLSPLEEKQPRW